MEQNEAQASYSLWRDEFDYFIDWSWPAEKVVRHIHASGPPYSGAKAKLGDEVLTIHDAYSIADMKIINRTPGKVVFRKDGNLVVACSSGLIAIPQFLDGKGEQVPLPNLKYRFF